MKLIALEVVVWYKCSLSLIQQFYIAVPMPFLGIWGSGACEKFRPGSSRIPTGSYQNRRASHTSHNTLEWVSSASCSELERPCSLTLNSCVQNKLCCALALVSVIFLNCLSTVPVCCSHLDYSSVTKPLYVHVDCYLMLLHCRKGFCQLEMCCSTSPLHFPSSA